MSGYIGSRVVVSQVDGYTKTETQTLVDSAAKSNAEVKTAYEANADTNEFSDAEVSKLAGIAAGATAGVAVDSSKDVALLYLYSAENKGDRLNMVDGIVDSFGDVSDLLTIGDFDLTSGSFSLRQTADAPEDMTSNTAPTPTVVSNSDGDSNAYFAFDGTSSFTTINSLPGWAKIDFGSGTSTAKYMIRPGVAAGWEPKTWTFQGSDDDSSWTTLDTQANITTGWTNAVNRYFTISAATYRYYRLNVSAVNATAGSNAYFQGFAIEIPAATFPVALTSNSFTADTAPTTARLGVQATGSLTINTHLVGHVSRDGGTTWTQATLALVDTLADGTKYYEDAAVDISGQPSGTSMQYKIVHSNAAWTSTDGVLLQWS